jgi:hypothetical protein
MNDRIAIHCWRALGVGTVLLVLALHPQLASAQCAISYGDTYADDTNVWVWSGVTDYYNSYCYPGTYNFVHGYYANVTLWSPSAITTNGANSSYAYGGGGSTEAWAVLAIQDEAGLWTFSGSVSIYCSILGGAIFSAGGGGTVAVGPRISTTGNEIWYFAGENPDPTHYPLSIALGSSAGEGTVWQVTQGNTKVNLTTSSSGALASVTSSAEPNSPIGKFSLSAGDIKITASKNNVPSAEFSLTSRAPWKLILTALPETLCFQTVNNILTTYATFHDYRIYDTLDVPFPLVDIGVNEKLGTPVGVYTGTNWTSFPITETSGQANRDFTDVLGVPIDAATAWTPHATCSTTSAPSGPNVMTLSQVWRVGSTTPGKGRAVQSGTVNHHTDFGVVDPIVSPIP